MLRQQLDAYAQMTSLPTLPESPTSVQTPASAPQDGRTQSQRVAEQEEAKKQMLNDQHALVVPDGTEVIGSGQY